MSTLNLGRGALRAALLAASALSGISVAIAAAPPGFTSKYYLGGYSSVYTLQGSSVIETRSNTNYVYYNVMHVHNDIRTMDLLGDSYSSFSSGTELFPLTGPAPGLYYSSNSIFTQTYDGTSDGVYNYTISYYGEVIRSNRDFSNPTVLYNVGFGKTGITYQQSTNSLWISDWNDTYVTNYSLGGLAISSFSTGHSYNTSLALDPADNTLWLYDQLNGIFKQYSLSGALLGSVSSVSLFGYSGGWFSAEFDLGTGGGCPVGANADTCAIDSSTNQATAIDAAGGNDTLELGGTTNFSFALPGLGTTYTNFENLEKTGANTVTLTGVGGVTGALNNKAGVLTLGAGAHLSAATITNDAGATINVGVGATLQGTGNTLNNAGVTNIATNGIVTDAGDINNLATGVFNFNGPGGTATFSSGTGVISNLGAINVNSGNVAVTGSITNSGTGTIVLASGAGNMTGIGTLTNSSTAPVGVSVATGTGLSAVTIVNQAGATFSNAGTVTTTGGTSNAGTFNNSGSVTGGLTNTGTTNLNAGGNLNGGTIANNAPGVLNVNGATTNIGAVTQAAGASTNVTVSTSFGSLAGAGALALTGTLTTGGNNASTAFTGTTSGAGGLTKAGTGVFATGNLAHTGLTNVSAGTLRTNGTVAGSVTVANGATFTGNFIVAGTLTGVGPNSIIAVGNSPGSATIAGLAGVTVQNVEVQFNNAGAPVNGTTHDFLNVTGNVSGTHTVNIIPFAPSTAPVATTGNGIELFRVGGSVASNAFVLSGPVIQGGFEYLLNYLPDYSGTTDGFFLKSTSIQEVSLNAALLGAGRAANDACRDKSGAHPGLDGAKGRVWADASDSNLESNAANGLAFDADTNCVRAGFDAAAGGNLQIGLSGGILSTSADVFIPQGTATLDGDGIAINAHAAYVKGPMFVQGSLGYASTDWSIAKAKAGVLGATVDGLTGRLGAGHKSQLFGAVAMTLSAALDYDGTSCGSGCLVAGATEDVSNWSAGVYALLEATSASGRIRPYAGVGFSTDLDSGNSVSFGGATTSVDAMSGLFDARAGFEARIWQNLSLSVEGGMTEGLDSETSGRYGRAGAKLTW